MTMAAGHARGGHLCDSKHKLVESLCVRGLQSVAGECKVIDLGKAAGQEAQ